MREGDLLWEPHGPSKLADYMRGARLLELRRAVALVGRGPGGVLGLALGALRGRARRPSGCSARDEMPGAEWFPGARLNYAEQLLPQGAAGRDGDRARDRVEPAGRALLGRARATRWRAAPPACAGSGVGRGDRVAAYMPNVPETVVGVPRHARASARSGRAARPSSARPPWSTASRRSSRRSCSRPRATATAARTSTAASACARSRPRSPRSSTPCWCRRGWDELLAEPAELELRAAALRPPALGALLVGHDGAAEGDRAGPGRHPARAPEEGEPALATCPRTTASSGSPPPAG